VTSRTAALRYARALFDVILKEAQDRGVAPAAATDALTAVEAQLTGFHELVTKHVELERVLLNPAVPAPRKRAAVAEVIKRVEVAAPLGKLLVLLAERDRLALLPEVVAAYHQRLLDHQNIVRAEVTTAAALAPERTKQIESGLARATGRTVVLSTRVDPSLIGGAVTRIGSTVYDGSVTGQLQRMKESLH
jgi:F-type H+-transporting ATPase subunit delta